MNVLDRAIMAVAPVWGVNRIKARSVAGLILSHYEAAAAGRRTANWARSGTDANQAMARDLGALRFLARDLTRNNAWARNGKRVITRNVVGYGIMPKPLGLASPDRLVATWKRWADSTECDADGRTTFYGLQKLAMNTIVEAGEVLVRRRPRWAEDGLAIPLQLQVLEPDFVDTSKDGVNGQAGGPIIQGVEFDKLGKRAAYWLYDAHPGSGRSSSFVSKRVPASEIVHVFDLERAGQVRGPSWLGSVIVKLREFDEFEDAELVRQKIAACLAGFIHGESDTNFGEPDAQTPNVQRIQPGTVQRLAPGQEITFSQPPGVVDTGFSNRTLRSIAAGLGVTYEDLTGDYSQVNYSSARMSRLAHWANVYDWQWNMLIPQLCVPLWTWAMDAAVLGGVVPTAPAAEWTPQPMPLIEPDKEAMANLRMVRSGQKTLSQVLREQGIDPDTHFQERADELKRLDELKIWTDSDPRRVSQAGLTQERVGLSGGDEGSKEE